MWLASGGRRAVFTGGREEGGERKSLIKLSQKLPPLQGICLILRFCVLKEFICIEIRLL